MGGAIGRCRVLLVAVLALIPASALAREPVVTARAALVMNATTGEVLWEKNASDPLPPASTTKVMTAILALESERLDESFRVSAEAAEASPSKINLHPGQRVKLRDLVYATLLNSANDAATVVAEGMAGSESAFADRMNERASQLGARSAHFVNPHGLTAPGHVASARDLAVIFRHGLGVPQFREILATRTTRIPVDGPGAQWVALRSHNRLLSGYSRRVIGKTGYTRAARRCFVGAASEDGREIIVVLLGSGDLWGDAKRLFAFGFGDSVPTIVAKAAKRVVRKVVRPVVTEGDIETTDDLEPGGRYAVQLGPYKSRDTAVTTRTRLARRGYRSVLSGKLVRIGSFESLAEAQGVARRLRKVGYHPLVVALR